MPGPGKPGALAVAPLEPFELSFDKAAAYFGTALDFTFRSPSIPNFERMFTVGRLRLTRLELADGTTLEPPPPGAPAKSGFVRPTWETPTKPGRPNRFWATSVSNSRAELADSSADDRASEYQPLAICDDTFGNSRADSLLRIS